jgi:hypothetical protein
MASGFDDVVKPVYRRWFLRRGVPVETEREVLAHTRTMDLVADVDVQMRRLLEGTCFDFFSEINVVEFKGAGDPLTEKGYARAMSRAWAVVKEERLPSGESPIGEGRGKKKPRRRERVPSPIGRTLTIVCVTRPNAILNGAARGYHFEPTDEPGIYISRESLTVRIIVPYEMELVERNYPLMPLATGLKLQRFVEQCAREARTDLLQMSLELAGATGALEVWPQVMEEAAMKSPYTPEVLAVIEEGIRKLPDLPTNKRIRELEEKARQAEAMLSQAEANAAQAEANAILDERRRSVLRLAGRKFGSLPPHVALRVEAAQEMGQLNTWFDQIVDAGSLNETDLGHSG